MTCGMFEVLLRRLGHASGYILTSLNYKSILKTNVECRRTLQSEMTKKKHEWIFQVGKEERAQSNWMANWSKSYWFSFCFLIAYNNNEERAWKGIVRSAQAHTIIKLELRIVYPSVISTGKNGAEHFAFANGIEATWTRKAQPKWTQKNNKDIVHCWHCCQRLSSRPIPFLSFAPHVWLCGKTL